MDVSGTPVMNEGENEVNDEDGEGYVIPMHHLVKFGEIEKILEENDYVNDL